MNKPKRQLKNSEVGKIKIYQIMKWKCTKCGQVVTSPPLNNDCPKGGSHSWVNAKHKGVLFKSKTNLLKIE